MPVFWRNKNRHDRHDHHTHVTTTGARVVEARDDGRGRTVVAVTPAANVSGTYVTSAGDRRHNHRSRSRRAPSTIHGLWNRILGTLTGNRRRRRRGEREMRKAREERHALRTAEAVQRVRDAGPVNKLRKFRHRHQHKRRRHRHHTDEPAVIARDDRHSHNKSRWGHHSRRTRPPYYGAHHRLFGFLTGQRDRVARGEAMAIAADEERRRERRRRREEMRDHGRDYRERGVW